jgi:all-trans-8'-apo-beta-carotenal 15,15'-oxygenase
MSVTIPPPPRQLFQNLKREHDFEEREVLGKLPGNLHGTLFRMGIGQMDVLGQRYSHVFEADGAISALRITGGRAEVASRLVQSAGLLEEKAAGRPLYGTAARWNDRFRAQLSGKGKNTANTHIVAWERRLFAMMEGAKPTEIDPVTLATLGERDFEGVVTGAFSAHPRRCNRDRALYNFGISYGKQTTLQLYRLGEDGKASRFGEVPLEFATMVHDFAVTEKHAVFLIAPLRLTVWKVLLALGSVVDHLVWAPQLGTEVIVVPLAEPSQQTRFRTDAFYPSHFGNAFERGEELFVDYIRYPDANFLTRLGDGLKLTWTERDGHDNGVLHRAVINPARRSLQSQPRWEGVCEFPRYAEPGHERFSGDTWVQSESYVDNILRFSVARVDSSGTLTRHMFPAGHYCSEPVFVPVKDGNSLVVTHVHDSFARVDHVVFLDAGSLDEVARVPWEGCVPLTFHGSWVPVDRAAES